MKHLLGAFAAAAFLSAAAPAVAEDIVIGHGGIFSGPYSTFSEDSKRGMDMYLEEINAAGGVLGKNVRVEYYDTVADRAKSIAIARKWASDPAFVAYTINSSIEFAALDPIMDEMKIPLVTVGASGAYKDFGKWSFRSQPVVVDKAMPVVLKQLSEKFGAKTIAVICDTANTYTVTEMQAVKDYAAGAGMEVVGAETFQVGQQDFSAQLTNIAAAKPDVLYLAGSTFEAALIISQARDLGIQSKIIGGATLNDPRIAQMAGNVSEGVLTYYAFDANSERPIVQNFVKKYREKYNAEPPAYAALGYDVILLITDAVKRAGSTDREAIRTALGQTKKLESVSGSFSYDGPGNNLDQSPLLFENKGGKFERLK